MAEEGALAGVLVLETGGREAAGICGSLLAQLGATVVVAEPEANGRPRDVHRPQFLAGKLSVPDDPDIVARLASVSDIVITSSDLDTQVPGVPADAILADITAFGESGPLAGRAWSDVQIQAFSGIMDTTGFPDAPPVAIGVPIVSYLTGTYGAGAVLAALRAKRLQGIGQRIELAMFDAAFVTLNAFLSSVLTSETATKTRLGNRHPTVAPWNVYQTSDGMVLICAGNQGQWERLCEVMDRPDVALTYATQASRIEHIDAMDAEIEAWTRTVTTEDCVARLAEMKVAAGPIAPIDGHPREANIDFRKMIVGVVDAESDKQVRLPRSPLRMGGAPGKAPADVSARGADLAAVESIIAKRAGRVPAQPKPVMERPLAGLRVIEIGQYTTAPLCARHLAHLGAEVIKVEQPGGDESRAWVPHVAGQSASFRLNNSDKRSIILDLRSEEGAATLRALLQTADALVENSKPGTLAKFGLPPERIQAINPRIVHCAISGFGAQSLYWQRPAFDMVIQAMSGYMTALQPGGTPLKSGISAADTMGAVTAIVATLAGLEQRDRTGKGQYIDLSMQDITCWLTQTVWNTDIDRIPRPTVLATEDGFVMVEAPESEIARLAGTADPLPMTREEAAARFLQQGLAAAPVNSVREAAMHPHTMARRLWYRMSEGAHAWPVLASPMLLKQTPPVISRLSPKADEDRESLLEELAIKGES